MQKLESLQQQELLTQIRPLLHRLTERAQEEGTLRPDVTAEDLPLVLWATARVIESTADVAPDHWRRYLGLVLDGLRASAATPLPRPPLTPAQLADAERRRDR